MLIQVHKTALLGYQALAIRLGSIYIYIEREREKDLFDDLFMCIYIYIYTHRILKCLIEMFEMFERNETIESCCEGSGRPRLSAPPVVSKSPSASNDYTYYLG